MIYKKFFSSFKVTKIFKPRVKNVLKIGILVFSTYTLFAVEEIFTSWPLHSWHNKNGMGSLQGGQIQGATKVSMRRLCSDQ